MTKLKYLIPVALILSIFLICGCEPISNNDSSPDTINLMPGANAPATSSKIDSCEDFAKRLIPTRITLGRQAGVDTFCEGYASENCNSPARYGDRQTWLDGSEMEECGYTTFRVGESVGENVNYFYQSSVGCSRGPPGYQYSKQIIDAAGKILGEFNFGVYFDVKPIEHTITIAKTSTNAVGSTFIDYVNQDFEVVSYALSDCNLPKGINLNDYIQIKCIGVCLTEYPNLIG